MFLTQHISSITLALCLSLCLSVSPALSQEKPTSTIEFKAPPERGPKTLLPDDALSQLETKNPEVAISANMFLFMDQRLQANMTVEDGLLSVLTHARSFDLDGKPGIGFDDFRLSYQIEIAAHRARFIHGELTNDLDADGTVTAQEAEVFARRDTPTTIKQNGVKIALTPEQLDLLIRRKRERILASDANGDDVVTLEEMVVAFTKIEKLPEWSQTFARPAETLQSFDTNGDKITSEQELTDAYRIAIAKVDQNQNGVFDVEELSDMMRTIDREFARQSGKRLQFELKQIVRDIHRNSNR